MQQKLITATALIAALVTLGGCEGTDRPLSYEKGVYGGQADQKLTEQQVEALRQRGTLQY